MPDSPLHQLSACPECGAPIYGREMTETPVVVRTCAPGCYLMYRPKTIRRVYTGRPNRDDEEFIQGWEWVGSEADTSP